MPNPSFEIYDTCPTNAGQIYRAAGWSNYGYDVDYCNPCASPTTWGVPQNVEGYQVAEDGNAYCDIQVYQAGIIPNGSEFLGRQLSQPLVIGQRYYCSFYVSFVDSGQYVSVNKIGLKFSTVPFGCAFCYVAYTNLPPVTNSAAIYTNNIITDHINWTQISGLFVADSAYDYVMLGNFFDAAHTDTTNPYNSSASDYYFDNVYVGIDSTISEGLESTNTSSDKINIYPNPANESLTISSPMEIIENVELFSIDGKLIYSESLGRTNIFSMSVVNFNQGIYFIKILSTNNYTVKKVQIFQCCRVFE